MRKQQGKGLRKDQTTGAERKRLVRLFYLNKFYKTYLEVAHVIVCPLLKGVSFVLVLRN